MAMGLFTRNWTGKMPVLLPGGPGEFAAGEEVEVEMRNFLAGVAAVVEDETVAASDEAEVFCDGGGFYQQMAEDGVVGRGGVFEGGNGFARDDEDMCGRHGLDVPKRDDVFVFVDDVGGDFFVADFLEEGFHENSP